MPKLPTLEELVESRRAYKEQTRSRTWSDRADAVKKVTQHQKHMADRIASERIHRQELETACTYALNARAAKCGAVGRVTTADVHARVLWSAGMCAYCGVRSFDCIDHFIPLARLGSGEASNLVAACAKCNSAKSDQLPMEWCFSRFDDVGFVWVRLGISREKWCQVLGISLEAR